MHGLLNPTLKEGVHHMKRLSVIALVVAVALALSVWTPAPATAQTPVQRGKTVDLLFYSLGGTSRLSFGATYPFSFILDGTLNYASGGGSSQIDLGAKYWFPVTAVGLAPYVGAGVSFMTAPSQTGIFLGGGAALRLAPQWNGYVGINWVSAGGTSTTTFDVGAQYIFTSRVGAVVGLLSPSSGNSAVYLGVTLNY